MKTSYSFLGLKIIFQLLIFLISIIGIDSPVHAHPGGHYLNETFHLNTWKLKSGTCLQGNFLMNIGDTIVLEQMEGKSIRVALQDLAAQDQRLAKFKIKQLSALNKPSDIPAKFKESEYREWSFFDIIFKLVLLGLMLCYLFSVQKSGTAYKWLSFSLLFLFMITVSFNDKKESIKTDPAFLDSAFSDYKPAVKTSWDENYFYVESNGLPNHQMMVGITSWQQQVPLPQNYTKNNHWSITLHPEYASQPLSLRNNFMRGAIAIAVNGIPIFNALNNRGDDAYIMGELDKWGGHCGRGDDYHYHIAPAHLANKHSSAPIAFALDGFAIYGTEEPDGSAMKILDSCHGHLGVDGNYHYHGTTNYPYTIAYMRGKVSIDDSKPAPENQISPQPFLKPVRPPGRPLRGASIVDFTNNKPEDYTIKYKMGNQYGFLNYSWDNEHFYFTATAPDGSISKTNYQRR